MYLSMRPLDPKGFESYFEILQDRFLYSPDQRAALLRLWAAVLREHTGESCLVLDERRPVREQLVGFGFTVFVKDWFADQAPAMPPYIGLRLLELWQQGRSPILTKTEVARANVGNGLNVLSLHVGWPEERLTPLEIKQVRHFLTEAFVFLHRGYQIRSLLHEFFGEEDVAILSVIGGRVLSDYRWYFHRFPAMTPPPERWPYLGGITRSEALEQEGTISFTLFTVPPPRFWFSPREQEVLRAALLGKTDEAIGEELGLSLVTVKKLWKCIYARVAAKHPSALPFPWPEVSNGQGRQKERRRFLLDYLRLHPEELRLRATRNRREQAHARRDTPV